MRDETDAQAQAESAPGQKDAPGGMIISRLAELPERTLLDEQALAAILQRHPASVRRAVERGELPPPMRFLGKPTWTAGAILRHAEKRLEAAAKEAERAARKISRLSP